MIYQSIDDINEYSTLRLILGDQLNANHSWYKQQTDNCLYLIAELPQEISYVKHHIQKICAFFSAMDNFAHALSISNHHVLYLTLDQTHEYPSLEHLIRRVISKASIEKFEYQTPDEYRLKNQIETFELGKKLQVKNCDSEHFYLRTEEFKQYIKPNKHNRLESFYRKLRRRYSILMDGDGPIGGQWNYDKANRNKLKVEDLKTIPRPLIFRNNVEKYKARIDKYNFNYFGEIEANIVWPTTRKQALELLDFFCENCLQLFGKFQDAMTENSDFSWALYHSRLSFALNTKMISPQLVIKKAIETFENSSTIELAQIEGFVRQILGWREYIRAVYWQNMPDYSQLNYFKTKKELPSYFWSAKTKMNCMAQTIKQSLKYAYAHHIQRLMITGNFALLSGINIAEIEQWYLGIYIDAIEWVELPNTLGMSQFADGGLIATKPYSASGNYINNMSDYCKSCHYQIKEKETDNACPFNSLYWHFLDRHKDQLGQSPRLSLAYRNWNNKDSNQQKALLKRADYLLNNIEDL